MCVCVDIDGHRKYLQYNLPLNRSLESRRAPVVDFRAVRNRPKPPILPLHFPPHNYASIEGAPINKTYRPLSSDKRICPNRIFFYSNYSRPWYVRTYVRTYNKFASLCQIYSHSQSVIVCVCVSTLLPLFPLFATLILTRFNGYFPLWTILI